MNCTECGDKLSPDAVLSGKCPFCGAYIDDERWDVEEDNEEYYEDIHEEDEEED